jgi:choline/glycine/proline betaine transport protein
MFWAVVVGAGAAALLVGGGLVALQTAAITTGLPFALVLLFMIYSLRKGLAGYTEGPGFSLPPYEHGHVFRTVGSHPEPEMVHGHVSWIGRPRTARPSRVHHRGQRASEEKSKSRKRPGGGERGG